MQPPKEHTSPPPPDSPQLLTSHQRLAAARTPQEKVALERQIAATDTQLDKLVYALYGLTEHEIQIVEGATQ